MIPIGDIEINGLRSAIKDLNNSGLIADKIKAFGKKDELLKKFIETVDAIPEEVILSTIAAAFYNKIFELEETTEGVFEETTEEVINESVGTEESKEEPPEKPEESVEETKEVEEERPADSFKAKEIKKILMTLQPATLKRSTIDQYTRFKFTGDEIMSYSGNMCILHPFKTDFECSIKADDLVKVFSQSKGDVRLSFEENQLKIEGDFKAGFVSQYKPTFGDDLELVQEEIKNIEEWKDLPADFCKGATLTHFAASKKEMMSTCCIMVDGNDVAATDGIRLGHYVMDAPMDHFFIRAKSAKYIAGLNPIKYTVTDSWAYFKTDKGVIIGSRRMMGDFPDYKFEETPDDIIEILPAPKLTRALKGVAALSDEVDSQMVDIKAHENQLTVSSSNERGWAEKIVDIEYDGTYEFGVDPSLMLQALQAGVVNLKMFKTYIVLESGNFKHMIAKKVTK